MSTTLATPSSVDFRSLPVLDVAQPDLVREGNHRLAELRTAGPVCQIQPTGSIGFLRWADCDAILRDARTFSSAYDKFQPVPGAEAQTTYDTLLWQDPPDHQRVRGLVQQAFTTQRVAAMEPHTREIVRRLLDQILARGEECEFHHDFAVPLPSYVMSGLLGVDESMMDTFNRWANSTFHGPREAWSMPPGA
ncbi:MAG: cytochrome P450, partial [Chloroflexi bacterium]|nr:cytochrome P450 [Chloroflexota bacterium]